MKAHLIHGIDKCLSGGISGRVDGSILVSGDLFDPGDGLVRD